MLALDHEQRGIRLIDSPNSPVPRVALLGHTGYSTMVTNAGSGFSRSGDIAINRWRNDGTCDNHGQWCYVRDLRSGLLWSSGHQPVCTPALSYRVTMSPDRVSIQRQDGSLETRTDIVVVADRPAESRRVTIANSSAVAAEVELTSYQEIVLATPLSDRGHRAFGNLFVQTEWVPEAGSILAMRRPRSKETRPAWCGHTIAVQPGAGTVSCETDRARFLGRGRTSQNPVAMGKPGELSGTVGAVLDPVFALRTVLSIPPGRSAQVIFSTYAAVDRDEALRLASSFNDWEIAQRSFDENHADDSDSSRGIAAADSALYQDLAGLLLYGARSAGPVIDHDKAPAPTRADILAIGITGEWPIVLARVRSRKNAARVNELLRLHRYWRSRGIIADLVFLCSTSSNRWLPDDIVSMVAAASGINALDQSTGVFVRNADSLRVEDVDLLESIARIWIDCATDSLRGIAGV